MKKRLIYDILIKVFYNTTDIFGMKNDLTNSVSAHVLQNTLDWKAVKSTLLPRYKSAYQLYLESKKRTEASTNLPLTKEELDAVFKTFRFISAPGESKRNRALIYEALSFINQKSPTGRLLLKQFPPNILIDMQESIDSCGGTTAGIRRIVHLNRQIMQKNLIPALSITLTHEIGHIIDAEQVRTLSTNPLGYYSAQGEKIVFFSPSTTLTPRQQFILHRLQEAERKAIDIQIAAETRSFGQLNSALIRGITKEIGNLYRSFTKQQPTQHQKDIQTQNLIEQSLISAIFPKMRYLFFKWGYKLGINKIPDTLKSAPKATNEEIQNAAAKKAIATLIKENVSSKKPFLKTERALDIISNTAVICSFYNPKFLLLLAPSWSTQLTLLTHQVSVRLWKSSYDKDSFLFTDTTQKKINNRSEEYLNAYLLSLCDKYNNHLQPTDINHAALDQWPTYKQMFEAWEKINSLPPQIFNELKDFSIIQTINNLQEEIEENIPPKEAEEQTSPDMSEEEQEEYEDEIFSELTTTDNRARLHAEKIILAGNIYDEAAQKAQKNINTTIEEEIRKRILNALTTQKAQATTDYFSYNMLETSKDADTLNFLLNTATPLPESKTGRRKLSTKISRLIKETQTQTDEAAKNNKNRQKELLRQLVVLRACLKTFHQKNKALQEEQQQKPIKIHTTPILTAAKIKKNIQKKISQKHVKSR